VKIKHNKLKNTYILFELLSRQIATDALNDMPTSNAINIIKKHYSKSSELLKEYNLYKKLLETNFSAESKAQTYIDFVLNERKKLNAELLRTEKYNVVNEISKQYDIKTLFNSKISNYKECASIYKLFEYGCLTEAIQNTEELVDSRDNILSIITNKKITTETSNVVNEFMSQSKDLRALSYNILVDKFNSKYGKSLNKSQCEILRTYLYNATDSIALKEYINKKTESYIFNIKKLLEMHDDKVLKAKLSVVLESLEKITKQPKIKESYIVALMETSNLIVEMKKSLKLKQVEVANDT
jgi:hypothetical protein